MNNWTSHACTQTLIAALLLSAVTAQDVQDADAQLAPNSIEEVLDRLGAEEELAAVDLAAAEQSYREATEASDAKAVKELSQIASTQIKEGDLTGARNAWEAVLDIDPKHLDATAFFRTIGRLDVVKAKRQGEERMRRRPAATLVRTAFATASNKQRFELTGPGAWLHNGSKQFVEEWRTPYTIALKASDGTRYRLHADQLYGRKGDSKWYLHGGGSWVRQ